jgi:hypothetical protein
MTIPYETKRRSQRGACPLFLPDRQQYMSADRGDANQSRHREVRCEGLAMFSKQKHTKGYTIVPPTYLSLLIKKTIAC